MMNRYSGLGFSPRKVSYMKYLLEHGGCAKISELAGPLGVDPSPVTRTVQELEGEEYLLHDPDSDVILPDMGGNTGPS